LLKQVVNIFINEAEDESDDSTDEYDDQYEFDVDQFMYNCPVHELQETESKDNGYIIKWEVAHFLRRSAAS
jgi:hypothetical protein